MFVRLADARTKDRADVGGKAARLGEVARLGLRVPNGFVVSTLAWDIFVKSQYRTVKAHDESNCNSPFLRGMFDSTFEEQLMAWFDTLQVDLVAVRSSSVAEDSATLSYAGIFESLLGVHRQTLVNSIVMCWTSAASSRARAYCEANGVAHEGLRLAVLVQELLKPSTSGVCFTCNPLTENPSEMLIEAVWGFGEGIVSGKATPDSYVYDSTSRRILSKTVNEQESKFALIQGEVREAAAEPASADRQKLIDEHIHELAAGCAQIRDHFGTAQDIEFAVHDNALYFLQARPVTGVTKEGTR